MALAANQPHGDVALRDGARLAHLAAIHPHEVRLLGFERRRVALARLQRSVDGLGQREEIAFHQDSPPNTSTLPNTHAGVAWPTRMACDGSPFAAMRRAQHLQRVGVADALQAAPEIGRDAAIVGVLDHRAELAVLDHLPALASELELVARIVDGPRAVGLHQHAALDAGDHLVQRRIARLEVQVGHAVDRRTVPAVGARIGHACHSRARLRNGAAQRPLEDSGADQVDALGARAVVVVRVAREFLGPRRVERDVEEFGAVAIRAEHVRRDEARAGEIALVAQDAVEFQRMADRLVDLQDHLVRRQQHVHRAARAVRRRKQFERFLRDPAAAADESETRQHLGSALLAGSAIAVERANLRDAVRMGGDGHSRQQEPVALDDVAAGAGDQPVRCRDHIDGGLPVDDPRVASGLRRFLAPAVRTTRDATESDPRTTATHTRRAARAAAASGSRTAPDSRCCAPSARRARARRAGRQSTCRPSPRTHSRHRRRPWPSRRGRWTRQRASRRSCAPRRSRSVRRRSATTRNRRRARRGRSDRVRRSASGMGCRGSAGQGSVGFGRRRARNAARQPRRAMQRA